MARPIGRIRTLGNNALDPVLRGQLKEAYAVLIEVTNWQNSLGACHCLLYCFFSLHQRKVSPVYPLKLKHVERIQDSWTFA